MGNFDGGGLDVRDAPELKEVGGVAELGRRISVDRGRRRWRRCRSGVGADRRSSSGGRARPATRNPQS